MTWFSFPTSKLGSLYCWLAITNLFFWLWMWFEVGGLIAIMVGIGNLLIGIFAAKQSVFFDEESK